MDEFFKTHKKFTTSQARKAGISKKQIRGNKSIVELGTFPVQNKNGESSLETFYVYDADLAKLAKRANKYAKKAGNDPAEVKRFVQEVETKVRSILFEGDSNV